MNRQMFSLVALLAIAGCGSSTTTNGTGGNGAGGGGATGGGGSGGGGSGGGGGGTGGAGGGGGTTVGIVPPGSTLGTYIVLGDSISDQGGNAPFFYDTLHADLLKKYPSMTYVHAAQAGAITDNYSDNTPTGVPLLATQIKGLTTYPGDILVTITIGGNDLNAHAIKAIGGVDATVRGEFGTHLDAELGELATAGRLGTGKVYIVLANIYDFTDGQGDFATVKCGPGANVSAAMDTMVFAAWNGVGAASLAKVSGTSYDMHANFNGHGYNNSDPAQVWYDSASCIHPNATGHDQIRRSIYNIVTGETLP